MSEYWLFNMRKNQSENSMRVVTWCSSNLSAAIHLYIRVYQKTQNTSNIKTLKNTSGLILEGNC